MRWGDVRVGDSFLLRTATEPGESYMVIGVQHRTTPMGTEITDLTLLMSTGDVRTWSAETDEGYYSDTMIGRRK